MKTKKQKIKEVKELLPLARKEVHLLEKKPIKRKVVCVFGEWGKDTDFVLEPVDEGLDKRGYYNKKRWLGRSFWIQECEE